MYEENENVFFYLTLMNENYQHPAMPENKTVEDEIIKGIYQLERVEAKKAKANVQLMGSGTILQKVREAAQILSADYGISSDVYSVTSFNELAREGQEVTRWNMLHPESKQKTAYLSKIITADSGPAIAATDYVKNYSDQVRAYINTEYRVLGTDGFDQNYIVVAALFELANRGDIKRTVVSEAIKRFNINADKLNPLYA
jgi:pyruvate dehydrogenase E1 component